MGVRGQDCTLQAAGVEDPGAGKGQGSAEGALGSAVTPAAHPLCEHLVGKPRHLVASGETAGQVLWEDSPSPSQCPGSIGPAPMYDLGGCHTLFTPASAGGRVGRKWELGCPSSPQS